jgi:hypothetical protein
MNAQKILLSLSLAVVSSCAWAMEPDDEDISYMLNSTSHGYGFDREAHKKCVLERKKNAGTNQTLKAVSDVCRLQATPKKCRTAPTMARIGSEKSPQEICQEGCKTASAQSRVRGECSLN